MIRFRNFQDVIERSTRKVLRPGQILGAFKFEGTEKYGQVCAEVIDANSFLSFELNFCV